MLKPMTHLNGKAIAKMHPDQIETILMGEYLTDDCPANYYAGVLDGVTVYFCPALVPEGEIGVILPQPDVGIIDIVVRDQYFLDDVNALMAHYPA